MWREMVWGLNRFATWCASKTRHRLSKPKWAMSEVEVWSSIGVKWFAHLCGGEPHVTIATCTRNCCFCRVYSIYSAIALAEAIAHLSDINPSYWLLTYRSTSNPAKFVSDRRAMTTENFENTNHLVLNFYADGYTIAIKLNEFPVFTSETILETAKISYEETSLLDYIESEELPPLLVEMIDASPKLNQYKIWHNGCLIL